MTDDKDSSLRDIEFAPKLSRTMNLKQQLKYYLKDRGITASQLSKKASVPKQSLSGWLAGSNPRDVRQIKRVADVLGISIDHLMFGSGPEKGQEKVAPLDSLIGEEWFGGLFEVRLRRVKK
ncbi:helix-turn-helix domain-containing protein [Bdellovibrio sp. KM01]|uniref:helix-turn-helix domain-containing protein n=1 Tax=Bdellovibrio sp. KM01 TaxID=2748865 RepID=UPI0015E9A233|nr:helix-turn-helix transcriptional regulator [Bdellovibrio sp. KM01]QLY25695.1 helix-turn-helix transcriptional regulator [Bdellovibrio sp. KM01]